MVKRKFEVMGRILDDKKRSVVSSKRKSSLIKKAIELSRLCSLDINLLIFDRHTQRYVLYQSDKDFDHNVCQQITLPENRDRMLKYYTNDDYDKFFGPATLTNGVSFKEKFGDQQESDNLEGEKDSNQAQIKKKDDQMSQDPLRNLSKYLTGTRKGQKKRQMKAKKKSHS